MKLRNIHANVWIGGVLIILSAIFYGMAGTFVNPSAAVVAVSMEADLLILLSDIDGLYTADPHTHPEATLIAEIPALTREIWELAGGSGSSLGTGGMSTKLQAADICTQAGCDMVIANGSSPSVLYDIADGKPVGSRFRGKKG